MLASWAAQHTTMCLDHSYNDIMSTMFFFLTAHISLPAFTTVLCIYIVPEVLSMES